MVNGSLQAFLESEVSASPPGYSSNTAWGAQYATEIRRIIREYSDRRPRQLQKHLGPSEIGSDCDAQIVGKFAGVPATNHVWDPWPSYVGTAIHAELAETFNWHNRYTEILRWITEQKVEPHPDHGGTSDLYDFLEQSVNDHKALGDTSMAKVRRPEGPPLKYRVQLFLYARGFRNLGLPVKRVALIAYPRTKSTLDELYVWDHELTPQDDALVDYYLQRTQLRKLLALEVTAGRITMKDVPRTPDDDECIWCPFFRPEAARDGGVGCPGNRA